MCHQIRPIALWFWVGMEERRVMLDVLAQSILWIRGGDHKEHCIQATTLPLLGRGGRFLGAMAIFWETDLK